jgi:hypothetical protein
MECDEQIGQRFPLYPLRFLRFPLPAVRSIAMRLSGMPPGHVGRDDRGDASRQAPLGAPPTVRLPLCTLRCAAMIGIDPQRVGVTLVVARGVGH